MRALRKIQKSTDIQNNEEETEVKVEKSIISFILYLS